MLSNQSRYCSSIHKYFSTSALPLRLDQDIRLTSSAEVINRNKITNMSPQQFMNAKRTRARWIDPSAFVLQHYRLRDSYSKAVKGRSDKHVLMSQMQLFGGSIEVCTSGLHFRCREFSTCGGQGWSPTSGATKR